MIGLVGFVLSFLTVSNFFYAPHSIQLNNGNLNYEYTKGEGKVASFKYNEQRSENLSLEIEKNGFDMIVSIMGGINKEFHFRDVPSSVLDLESVSLENFYLFFEKQFSVSFKRMKMLANNEAKVLNELKLNCQGDDSQSNFKLILIKSCLQKMNVNLREYFSLDKTPLVKDFNLLIQNGSFQGEAVVDLGISGKLKSKGLISYNESLDRIILKVDEIKLGFFDVTGEAFDQFKKYESKNLRIQNPYIYILLTED